MNVLLVATFSLIFYPKHILLVLPFSIFFFFFFLDDNIPSSSSSVFLYIMCAIRTHLDIYSLISVVDFCVVIFITILTFVFLLSFSSSLLLFRSKSRILILSCSFPIPSQPIDPSIHPSIDPFCCVSPSHFHGSYHRTDRVTCPPFPFQ